MSKDSDRLNPSVYHSIPRFLRDTQLLQIPAEILTLYAFNGIGHFQKSIFMQFLVKELAFGDLIEQLAFKLVPFHIRSDGGMALTPL
jgi:hypothetical protein